MIGVCVGILTTVINSAGFPVYFIFCSVVVAPRPFIVVRVATPVSRRCPTAVREIGVGFSMLQCPKSTCVPASATRAAHVIPSLRLVIVVAFCAWNKHITRFSSWGLVSVDGSLSSYNIPLISERFNPLSFLTLVTAISSVAAVCGRFRWIGQYF